MQTLTDVLQTSIAMDVIGIQGIGIIDDVEDLTFSTSRQGKCVALVNVRIV